jgi:hypothetical protein
VEVPVQKQIQVPMVTKVQKMVDVPQVEIVDKIVEVPVDKHRHVPTIMKVQKQVEVPQVHVVQKFVDIPQVETMDKEFAPVPLLVKGAGGAGAAASASSSSEVVPAKQPLLPITDPSFSSAGPMGMRGPQMGAWTPDGAPDWAQEFAGPPGPSGPGPQMMGQAASRATGGAVTSVPAGTDAAICEMLRIDPSLPAEACRVALEDHGGSSDMALTWLFTDEGLRFRIAMQQLDPSGSEEDIPHEFLCPISQEVMRDAVSTSDGHTYERQHIEAWLKENQNPTSPITGLPLGNKALIPNHSLRKLIFDSGVLARLSDGASTPGVPAAGSDAAALYVLGPPL